MEYPHRLRITRPSSTTGTVSTETGDVAGGGVPSVLYDGPADVQDAGEAVPANASGMPWLQSDATAFLPPSEHEKLLTVQPRDAVEVFYPDSDRKAEGNVNQVRDFDDALLLVYR